MTAPATREFDSRTDLRDDVASALQHLLVAIADTKLLLGYHYGEWTFGPPELEAAVAGCSMCQTELGHVRLLHGILKAQYGSDPDGLVEERAANEFANVRFLDAELSDWARCIAATFVVDMALTRLLTSLKSSSFTPLRMSVAKMIEEERHHAHHGMGWFRTLAAKNEECRAAIEISTNEALASVVEWFGPSDDAEDHALVETGIKSDTNTDILRDYAGEIETTAAASNVELSVTPAQSLATWSPATRRSTTGGPEDDILYHLRGSKNAIFKLK
jgi:ring-1,2-phenylacetyl-CoA epoxidase subunit PaaA